MGSGIDDLDMRRGVEVSRETVKCVSGGCAFECARERVKRVFGGCFGDGCVELSCCSVLCLRSLESIMGPGPNTLCLTDDLSLPSLGGIIGDGLVLAISIPFADRNTGMLLNVKP